MLRDKGKKKWNSFHQLNEGKINADKDEFFIIFTN